MSALIACVVKVCGTLYDPAKGGCADGRCPRCTKRKQRGQPDAAPRERMAEPERLEVVVPGPLARRVEKMAGDRGVSAWIRSLIERELATEVKPNA